MNDTETQQLILNIIEHAQKGKLTEFHYITSWNEFRFYRQTCRATKIIIKTLETSLNNLFKSYCKDITVGNQDVNNLLAFSQIRKIADFYKLDLAILKYMLKEYDEYLGKGNFWYSFLGGERKL